jgi:hypothetical protein
MFQFDSHIELTCIISIGNLRLMKHLSVGDK